MPSFIFYKLLEACLEPGCPVCRLEQESMERYLDNQFYENVNSPAWRDHLRLSLGFCREHARLGVEMRLGDALGYSIIYHDILNSLLRESDLTPRKRCPACEHLDEIRLNILSALVADLRTSEMSDALHESEGLCLPHLRQTLETIKDVSLRERLLTIQRAKFEGLRAELAEFIRKNDYQAIKEGFGSEGNAWLRAIGMVAGSRKER